MKEEHPTPRTDEAALRCHNMPKEFAIACHYVHADFARELERELAAEAQDKHTAIEMLNDKGRKLAEAKALNAELAEALAGLLKMNEEHNAAIESVIGRPLGWDDSYLDEARAALAKWKEGMK